jgi:undecaprenyl-diphosphatase
MGASAVAAAAPSPGGLGPLEAALVAALTGFGMASGPAVSAVLTYRLITYWLPVLPGWLSWNLLRRWAYV